MSFLASEKRSPLSTNGRDFDSWPAYFHSLSQKGLEMCTESLGSETGSDDFLFSPMDEDYNDNNNNYPPEAPAEVEINIDAQEEEEKEKEEAPPLPEKRKSPAMVNYHCSSGRSPIRSFPPPLTSICNRDGTCISMRRRHVDGRLVIESVPASSQNYLNVQRSNGRLLLSFINTSAEEIYPKTKNEEEKESIAPGKVEEELKVPSPENIYVTAKRTMKREEVFGQVRRCGERRRPLFVWEPYCVASS